MDADGKFRGYTSINLEVMRLGQIPGFDLYIKGPGGPVLYREQNIPFNRDNLQSLLENEVEYLYFKMDDEDKYFAYIENNLEGIIDDNNVPITNKATIAYDTSAYLARQMLSAPESEDLAKRASSLISTIITFTSRSDASYKDIVGILPQDYYTHTHSANVATYSLALGRELGLTVNTGLWELTMGALLHDVGKARVPGEILNKTSPLNSLEIAIIKKHVEWGLEIVKKTSAVPYRSYPAIAQHHERLDGSGYPAGITNMHLFGKIVAVADSFDAITTNRPYEKAKPSFTAVSILKSCQKQYDQNVVKKLVEVMADKNCLVRAESEIKQSVA